MWSAVDALVRIRTWPADHKSVLMVRVDAIGDFVLWIDAARGLVEYYRNKGKRIVLVGTFTWAQWARELCIFDEVIAISPDRFRGNPLYRFRMASEIRRRGCSIALAPTYSREFGCGDSIIYITGAMERIGPAGDLNNIKKSQKHRSDRWYTRLIPSDPLPSMILKRNAEFVTGVTGSRFCAKAADLRTNLKPSSTVAQIFSYLGSDDAFYVLFPGASSPGKQWPAERFGKVAELIFQATGWRGVICGTSSEGKIAHAIRANTDIPLLDLTGSTDLQGLSYVLSKARFLVANDTAAIHIAAAHGTPSVCILGGWHFGQFLPYDVDVKDERPLPAVVFHEMECFGCNWRCHFKVGDQEPKPCIDRISVEHVWGKIKEVCSAAGDVEIGRIDVPLGELRFVEKIAETGSTGR
jgi:ADP-heptose:LPS heptosyltransferase